MPGPRGVIARFYLYRAFVPGAFVYPVVALFMLDRGLSTADLGVAMAGFFLGTIVGEVPTGYVGDRLGRRNGLVLGSLAVTATMLGFLSAGGLPSFVALYVAWGVAITFRSGSTGAWLYDTLEDRLDTEQFTRVEGRGSAAFLASAAAQTLVGGALFARNPTYPFLAAAAVTAVGAGVAVTLPEPSVTSEERVRLGDAWRVVRDRFVQRPLAAFLLLSAAALAVPETVSVYVQPVARDVGMSPAVLGPYYALLLLAGAGVTAVADRLRDALDIGRWFLLAPALLAAALFAAVLVPVLALGAFVIAETARHLLTTYRGQYLNDRIPSAGRATVLSAATLLYSVVSGLARLGSSTVTETIGPRPALAIIGFGGLVVVVAFLVAGSPFGSTPAGVASTADSGD